MFPLKEGLKEVGYYVGLHNGSHGWWRCIICLKNFQIFGLWGITHQGKEGLNICKDALNVDK
jgi:hypothetical protein